jgi:ATP-dependent RNA helicase RhlE
MTRTTTDHERGRAAEVEAGVPDEGALVRAARGRRRGGDEGRRPGDEVALRGVGAGRDAGVLDRDLHRVGIVVLDAHADRDVVGVAGGEQRLPGEGEGDDGGRGGVRRDGARPVRVRGGAEADQEERDGAAARRGEDERGDEDQGLNAR